MRKHFLIPCGIIFLSVAFKLSAQVSDPQILMSVGDRPVTLQEFKSMYYKNLPKDSLKSQKALDNYLKLFTEFRLKVNAAIDARLDTTPSFKQEMNEYRQKLADPYMRDQSVQDMLLKQAYDRMKTDVKASHILIKVSPDASPADTLIAYKKILSIRDRILKKEITFEKAAMENSEDPSAKTNSGDLGYFTSLVMVYAFENAAYSDKVGEISMPIRTQFGYHIIKVTDKKPDPGQVLVAHIMIRTIKTSPADSIKLKNRIDSIYSLVKAGQNFADLAKKFSQDPASGRRGGNLQWFGVGRMPAPFEKVSFSLQNVGDVSAPFKTEYGWHIVKLLGKKALAPFDSMKDGLTIRVQKDERAEVSVNALLSEIKKKYNFTENPKAKESFYKAIDETFYTGKWNLEKAKGYDQTMFTLGGQPFTQQDFATFLVHNEMNGKDQGGEYAVNKLYPKFVRESLLKYKDNQLEREYPAFAEMITEYRDGILLFDITDKMVWTKALKDTSGLKSYYEGHKNAYMWNERAEATIYTCADEKVAKEVKKLMKDGKSDADILSEINKTAPNALTVQSGKFEKKENPAVDAAWKKGVSDNQTQNGKVVFVNVKNILPAQPKALDEVRGMITTDYQNYLMTQWLDELRAKYPVKINQQALAQVLQN
ncbi:MAG TPA: peptidylprolyl isomerase [Bacteroidia bacterium]|jgi:peptidyl-prolyl cis-trans isomerase SurA|nr:peptidylprolyl isomerase [Bacteroidia bacterium]